MSEKMLQALNEQMNFELYSGYIYLQMASYADVEDYDGFANWLIHQAHEEYEHAMKFRTFILDMGGEPEWEAMEKPKAKYESLLEIFKAAYDHEVEVSSRIHKLVDLSREEDCKRSLSFLQWFVDEQLEEEVSTQEIVTKLERVQNSVPGLYMLNAQLNQRG